MLQRHQEEMAALMKQQADQEKKDIEEEAEIVKTAHRKARGSVRHIGIFDGLSDEDASALMKRLREDLCLHGCKHDLRREELFWFVCLFCGYRQYVSNDPHA